MIDQNRMKQGYLTPGSHIQIESAEEVLAENPDEILLLAWNFKDEILDLLKTTYGFRGEVIIPLPYPPSIERLGDD